MNVVQLENGEGEVYWPGRYALAMCHSSQATTQGPSWAVTDLQQGD